MSPDFDNRCVFSKTEQNVKLFSIHSYAYLHLMHYSLLILIIISEPYGQKCFRQKIIHVLYLKMWLKIQN